jgi:hypothetical protein
MMRFIHAILLIFFCVAFSAAGVSAAEISAEDVVCLPGEEKVVEVWLSDVPASLAGYIMTPVLAGPNIADISFIPSEQFVLSAVDPDTHTVSALDLGDVLTSENAPFLLGTLQIIAYDVGETTLYFEIAEMTDDMGGEIIVTQTGITINVNAEERPSSIIGLQAQP